MASRPFPSLHHHHAFAPCEKSFRLSRLPLSCSPSPPSAPSFSIHGRPSLAPLRFSTTPPNSSFPRSHLPVALLLVPVVVSLRILFSVAPFDLPRRWARLVAAAERAEDARLPPHLYQAVVASEDRRFFHHFGVDPVGVSRAILSLSARGGGSTITQQVCASLISSFLFRTSLCIHAYPLLPLYLVILFFAHTGLGVRSLFSCCI